MLGLVFYQTTKGSSPVERYLRDQSQADRAILLEKLKAFCEEFPTLLTVSAPPRDLKLAERRFREMTS